MQRVFMLISVVGIVYVAFVIFLSSGKKETNNLLRKQLTMKNFRHRMESEKLQHLLNNAGIPSASGNINLFRYGAAGLYLILQLTIGYIRKQPPAATDFIIPAGIILVTSSGKFAPLGAFLRKVHSDQISKKDGEIISFLKLYENNRMKKRGTTEFSSFCNQVASHSKYLRQDLYELSQRSIDEGVEKAIDWFCNQFPANHPFINDVRSIMLATESMSSDEDAISYLNNQSKIIAKISADQYLRRWSNIGSISTFITITPAMATFLMIVVLSLMYVMIIKNQYGTVGL